MQVQFVGGARKNIFNNAAVIIAGACLWPDGLHAMVGMKTVSQLHCMPCEKLPFSALRDAVTRCLVKCGQRGQQFRFGQRRMEPRCGHCTRKPRRVYSGVIVQLLPLRIVELE